MVCFNLLRQSIKTSFSDVDEYPERFGRQSILCWYIVFSASPPPHIKLWYGICRTDIYKEFHIWIDTSQDLIFVIPTIQYLVQGTHI